MLHRPCGEVLGELWAALGRAEMEGLGWKLDQADQGTWTGFGRVGRKGARGGGVQTKEAVSLRGMEGGCIFASLEMPAVYRL